MYKMGTYSYSYSEFCTQIYSTLLINKAITRVFRKQLFLKTFRRVHFLYKLND